jgi:membrane-associated protease RseP (regulator of RpoE activity)
MGDVTADKNFAPVLTEIPRYQMPASAPTTELAVRVRDRPLINLSLFFATLISTTMAGAYMANANLAFDLSADHPLLDLIRNLATGCSFSIPLMAILLSHEMGHYIVARRNRVDTSLPYFIPAPYPSLFMFGTFGAFIRIRSRPPSRRAIFDIGAAGPWAGAIVAVPMVIIGLKLSDVGPLDTSPGGLDLGNSLLFLGLSRWVLGVDPNSVMVNLHPMAFAGWIGLFVTALNLLPVGQLDGGHVIYSLFGGRLHRLVSWIFVSAGVVTGLAAFFVFPSLWGGWLLWAILLTVLGLGHPSTTDPHTPLNPRRRLMAWATIALFIATFSPVPLSFSPPTSQNPDDKAVEVYYVPPASHRPIRMAQARLWRG